MLSRAEKMYGHVITGREDLTGGLELGPIQDEGALTLGSGLDEDEPVEQVEDVLDRVLQNMDTP